MPRKNTIRYYAPNKHYHVFNRGIEKRAIFTNTIDYQKFISTMKYYLQPQKYKETLSRRSDLEDNEIELLCYCLMPNHFHLLIKQNSESGLTRFMRRLSNTYVRYFNKAQKRIGALFEGKFKAILIETDEYLLHLSRYIHRNPSELDLENLRNYSYSSYLTYLGIRQTSWLQTKTILDFYKNPENSIIEKPPSYKEFVENYSPPDDPIKDYNFNY